MNRATIGAVRRPTVPGVVMRGGTSKGVFLHDRDLPPAGPERDDLLLEIMGSPDPMQIDGMGGAQSSTSKIMVVAPATEPGIDISYWFAQIGVDRPIVDWSGNCGNLTTAIAPFAIDEGIFPAQPPLTTVRLRNENTGTKVVAMVQVQDGVARVDGDFRIAGVSSPGSPIITYYVEPWGTTFGNGGILPTGSPANNIRTSTGEVRVSIVNVTHPYAFVSAADFDLDLHRTNPQVLNENKSFLSRAEEIRGQCSTLIGAAASWEDASTDAPISPRLMILGPQGSNMPTEPGHDLMAIGISMGKVHHALPMTGALCLGAAVAIQGTIPSEIRSRSTSSAELHIRHPKGIVVVMADVDTCCEPVHVRSVGVVRTARRLMSGDIYLRSGGE
jgi:2-methylaconitate cis-trans-isomerase PrpF